MYVLKPDGTSIDHVFSKARFTTANLKEKGVHDKDIADMRDRSNRLPNFQLLVGPENISKSDPPAEWVADRIPRRDNAHSLHRASLTRRFTCRCFWFQRLVRSASRADVGKVAGYTRRSFYGLASEQYTGWMLMPH